MDKVYVEGDDLVREVKERVKKLIDANVEGIVELAVEESLVSGQRIDTDDSSEIGELITHNGWTLYDLNLELTDVVDDVTDHLSTRQIMREYDNDELMDQIYSENGHAEATAMFLRAARNDSEDPAIIAELRDAGLNIPSNTEQDIDVWLQHNPGDALNKLGEQVVMELVEKFGWGKKVEKPQTIVIGDLEWTLVPIISDWCGAFDNVWAKGNGWRLPTVTELVGLYDYKNACCPFFQNDGGLFWSGQNINDDDAFAFGISSGTVCRNDMREALHVRFVRPIKKEEPDA